MPAPFLLVFDLDGTLAETAGDLIHALNRILAEEGAAPVAVEDARTLLGAGAKALITRGLAASDKQVPAARLEELYRTFLDLYQAHIADRSFLFPGVEAALDRFEAAGFQFAVCTNKVESASIKLLDALGVGQRFKAICGQDTFAVSKPDPQALLKTVERCGGDSTRTIMFGDSKTDIATAQAAHVPVVAVDFGYTDLPVSHFAPDRIISHYDEAWDAVQSLMRDQGMATEA